MLTNIKLKNFLAFREEIDVRIRPITILIGRNSAGKSTLIKFLLMLQQTLESSKGSFFTTEGRHINLGAFKDLKNSASNNNSLQFIIDISTKDLPAPRIQQIREEIKQSKSIQKLGSDSVEIKINLKTSSTIATKEPLLQEANIKVISSVPAREIMADFCISGIIPYATLIFTSIE